VKGVCIIKQLISFKNCFALLSPLCEGNVRRIFSFHMCLLATQSHVACGILPTSWEFSTSGPDSVGKEYSNNQGAISCGLCQPLHPWDFLLRPDKTKGDVQAVWVIDAEVFLCSLTMGKVAPEEDYQGNSAKEEQHGSPATSLRYGENCTV
jgi:hypothetical protein